MTGVMRRTCFLCFKSREKQVSWEYLVHAARDEQTTSSLPIDISTAGTMDKLTEKYLKLDSGGKGFRANRQK